MSKSELLDEDSRSFEANGEEEGFYSLCKEEFAGSVSPQHQIWSTSEDLNDSGHFTASPDAETAHCIGDSPNSRSPCPPSAHLILQMQHLDLINSQYKPPPQQCTSSLLQPTTQKNKAPISPRSVMTVKVPQNITPSVAPFSSDKTTDKNNKVGEWQMSSPRPETYILGSNKTGMGMQGFPQSSTLHFNLGSSLKSSVLQSSSPFNSNESGGDASKHHDIRSGDESCDYLRSILVNFNSLYLEKLRMIDDLASEGSDEQKKLLMEKKTNMLENWAKDVCVHNMVLVHTVEELEREANRKVSALQKKMTESTQLAKEHMTMIKKYEEQVKLLLKDHGDTEEKNLVLKIELEKLKSECRRVRDRMNMLLKDNESLLTLVCRIRDMGVWDINGLEIQRSSFDQIFGLYPNLVGGEVQTVFTREKVQHVKDTEKRVHQLEDQLGDLQRSQKEAEISLLQKDKKIEELEMEIKNVLNKAHYCEKECNDYKRSLLETQEKLLEATRRLAQSSVKSIKQIDLGETEMAELLKELRDVKSQLNTAVEEKQSAKEESSYFKRELSERLKEMHDIQNVFQNLATEVVTSRAAFQQVQEKEVQLQSLKSEVQTYQSRCADAEETIRKKELEIRTLQTQMNEIHRRKDNVAPTSVASIYSKDESALTSGKQSNINKLGSRKPSNIPSPSSIMKSKPKDVFSQTQSRIPVQTKPTLNNSNNVSKTEKHMGSPRSIWSQRDHRPPWNTNFKKSTSVLSSPPPALPPVPKTPPVKPTRSQSSLIRTSMVKTERGLEHLGINCQDIYEKLTELERHIAESKGVTKISNRAQTSSSNSALETERSEKLLKLPKVTNQDFTGQPALQTSTKDHEPKADKLPAVQDPAMHPSKMRNIPLSSRQEKSPFTTHVPDQRTPTPRLKALISAVVETSKKLLADGPPSREVDEELASRGRNYTITAAHYHRRRSQDAVKAAELRRTKSSEKNAEVNRCNGGGGDHFENDYDLLNNTPKRFYSSTEIQKKNPDNDDESMEVVYVQPQNVKEYLSKLPEDSCENIVKSWIRKSSSDSISEDIKKRKNCKSLPIRGKQGSVRVMKHLATRRYPRKKSSTKSNKSSEESGSGYLENEMFELEEEWGKVFANLEYKAAKNGVTATTTVKAAARDNQVEKPSGPISSQAIADVQGNYPAQSCTSIVQSTSMPSNAQCKSVESSSQFEGKEVKESIEDILKRLTVEKQEMEERYKRELEDKNVELKMQKLTIRHLQDAYVALKRGQPIPVPQTVTGNKIIANGNGNSNGHHKPNNNNNSQILDV